MKTVVAGALGECVHVAGVSNFLRLAESAGWKPSSLVPPSLSRPFLRLPDAKTLTWLVFLTASRPKPANAC